MRLDPFMLGSCTVSPSANVIQCTIGETTLQPRIMKVLVCLAEHAPETVTRQDLLDYGWPEADYVSDEALTKAISHLRKAFREVGCSDEMIRTVPKTGYRIVLLPVYQAPGGVVIQEEQESRRPAPGEYTTDRSPSPGRRITRAHVALAVAFAVLAGINVLLWSHLATTPEPQVRMVRRVMPYTPSTDQGAPLLRRRRVDTLFVGDDARRMMEALNSGRSLQAEIDEDS